MARHKLETDRSHRPARSLDQQESNGCNATSNIILATGTIQADWIYSALLRSQHNHAEDEVDQQQEELEDQADKKSTTMDNQKLAAKGSISPFNVLVDSSDESKIRCHPYWTKAK